MQHKYRGGVILPVQTAATTIMSALTLGSTHGTACQHHTKAAIGCTTGGFLGCVELLAVLSSRYPLVNALLLNGILAPKHILDCCDVHLLNVKPRQICMPTTYAECRYRTTQDTNNHSSMLKDCRAEISYTPVGCSSVLAAGSAPSGLIKQTGTGQHCHAGQPPGLVLHILWHLGAGVHSAGRISPPPHMI